MSCARILHVGDMGVLEGNGGGGKRDIGRHWLTNRDNRLINSVVLAIGCDRRIPQH